jgi:surfeit locus 1 family protein
MDPSIASSVTPSSSPEKRRLRPAWLPTVAAVFFALLTAWLGHWQLDRAAQKRALQARYDAKGQLPVVRLDTNQPNWRGLLYRRVRVDGVYDGRYQVFVDNRIHQGRPGYHVIAPLRFASGALLVNRGWLAAPADRSVTPYAPPPAGERQIEGLIVPARSRFLELSGNTVQGKVWENLDLGRYRSWYRSDLPNAMLLETSTATDGLVRDWPRPDLGIERHISYAVQWFSLTAAIGVLYVYFGIWRPRHAVG